MTHDRDETTCAPSAPASEPATERQTPSRVELTVRQMILLAAVELSDEGAAFPVEDLIVRSWRLYPGAFSLRGYHGAHPDSNRVLAKLAGADGLRGLGWLEQTDERTYRVTRKGRCVAKQLQAIAAAEPREPPPPPTPGEPCTASPACRCTCGRCTRVPDAVVVDRYEALGSIKATARALGLARSTVRARLAKAALAAARPPLDPALAADVAALAGGPSVALAKFLRGRPLDAADARAFWGPDAAATEARIKRVLDHLLRDDEGAPPDPRLPRLSTCYGLLNLHKILRGRFAREPVALGARGGDAP